MDSTDTLTIIIAVATLILIVDTVIILTIVLRLVLGVRKTFREVDEVVSQSKAIVGEVYDGIRVATTPIGMFSSIARALKRRGET